MTTLDSSVAESTYRQMVGRQHSGLGGLEFRIEGLGLTGNLEEPAQAKTTLTPNLRYRGVAKWVPLHKACIRPIGGA